MFKSQEKTSESLQRLQKTCVFDAKNVTFDQILQKHFLFLLIRKVTFTCEMKKKTFFRNNEYKNFYVKTIIQKFNKKNFIIQNILSLL